MPKFSVTYNNKVFQDPRTAVVFLEAFAGLVATHPLGDGLEPLSAFLAARVKVPAEAAVLADLHEHHSEQLRTSMTRCIGEMAAYFSLQGAAA